MKFLKNITRACLIISFAFIYSCSNSSSSSNASAAKIYNVDGAPTATETPASGSVISTTENIKIVFNESMDTSTLTLGGTLEPEATFAWSSTTYTDDTLIINPASSWISGAQTLTIDGDDLQGETLATLNLSYTVDAALTTYSVDKVNGGAISLTDSVTITFSEAMDITSLALSGTLLNASYDFTWTTTSALNDTLTISPQTSWNVGSDQTLSVDFTDYAGNYSSTIDLTFNVYDEIYYVTTSANGGNDGNDGLTVLTPKATIGAAITTATASAAVLITTGDYSESITLKDDVSLFGDFELDWSGKDATSSTSKITDPASAGGTNSNPNKAIYAGATITSATVIDDLEIVGGGGDYSSGIFAEAGGAPTVTNNTINGGTGLLETFGIHNNSSAPTITDNDINGGTGEDGSYGIYNNASAPDITNNTINGGTGEDGSYAIYNKSSSSPSITGNTINGGSPIGDGSYGIANNSSSPTITGNTINGGDSYFASSGIVNSNSSSPNISNNIINGGSGNNISYAISNYSSSTSQITGNTLNGGTGSTSTGIYNHSSTSTITDNEIVGGSGSFSYAVANNLASPYITGNTLIAGTGAYTAGIYNYNAPAPVITSNTIHGGEGNTESLGIWNFNSSPDITGNTIDGGSGTTSYGIYIWPTSYPTITNNIIFGTSTIDYGVYEKVTTGDPASLDNNVFYNSTTIYSDFDLTSDFTNMCSGNPGNGDCSVTLATPTGANNVLISGTDDVVTDLGFSATDDYHLTASSPVSVTEGGSSTGSIFTDRDGTARTVNWSIGAYEYD